MNKINNNETLEVLRDSHYFSLSGQLILYLLYVIVFSLNICGNLLIWLSVLLNVSLRSPMNYLLLNVAFSHIISGCAAVTFCFMSDIGKLTSDSYCQKILCGLVEGLGLYSTSCGANLLTLCGISFNRFLAIKFPIRQNWRLQKRGAILFNLSTWFISLAIVCPSFISFKYDASLRMCVRDWGGINDILYRICFLFTSTIIPTSFLTITFLAIVCKRRSNKIASTISKVSRTRDSRLVRAEKILGIIILTFFLFWSPFFIYWSLYTMSFHFEGIEGEFKAMRWLIITVLITTLNGVTDPFIYIFGSKDLRLASIRIYRSIKGKITGKSANRIQSVSGDDTTCP